MNTMIVLIRREVWENRSLWIVPLVIAAVLLLAVSVGGLHVNNNNFSFGTGSDTSAFQDMSETDRAMVADAIREHADKVDIVYAMSISALTTIELFAICVVVFFYLLDCLLQERKDRSILFWKSMPISDAQVVMSKVLTALVLAPLFVLLVSAVLQILVGAAVWLRFGSTAIGDFLPVWKPGVWLEVQAACLMFVPTMVLWYLPIAGYLLLVSIWSRRNAFLWAVLPWASLLLIETLLSQSHHVAVFLGRRFAGALELMALDQQRHDPPDLTLGSWASHLGNVYVSLEFWISIAVGVAFIFAAIRIRRYRDEN